MHTDVSISISLVWSRGLVDGKTIATPCELIPFFLRQLNRDVATQGAHASSNSKVQSAFL